MKVHGSFGRSVSFHFKAELYSGMSVGLESALIPGLGCLFSFWGDGGPSEETVGLGMEALVRNCA